MRPIINHLGGSHGRSALQKIDAQSLAASGDMSGTHIVLPQSGHGALTDLVGRNRRDKLHVMAVVGQRHRHVGLAAAIAYVKFVRLNELLEIGGGQPQHDFPHGNYHFRQILSHISDYFCRRCTANPPTSSLR